MHFNSLKLFVLFSLCLFMFADESMAIKQEEGDLTWGKSLEQNQGIKHKEYTVFDGNKGWFKNGITYKLACGPIIVECANGDLLCGWLSGSAKEPATDNCVLMSRSTDGGQRWSEPEIFIPAGEMAGALTNMHKTQDGRIVVFGAQWPSEQEYTVWHYFKMESFDNGHTWSKPQKFEIHNTNGFIGAGPIVLPNNKYLYVGSFFDKRKEPLGSSVVDIAMAKDESAVKLLEKIDSSSKLHSGKFGRYLHGCCVFVADDDVSTDFIEHGYIANRPLGLLEPTAVQLKSGRIVMLMRAEWGGFLWCSESDDNGRSWSQAKQTDIPNPSSLACLVKLPDDRIALINNPSGGRVGHRDLRSPLSLWISNDCMKSWEIKTDLFEGGQLAYPHGIVYNGDVVFVYDKNRREVKFVKIEL